MPNYPGVHSKKLKSGTKYYGAKWYNGKTYTTKLFPTAQDAQKALQKLIRELEAGIRKDKRTITVKQFIGIYLEKYLRHKQIDALSKKLITSSLQNAIIPIIGSHRLQSLTPENMQELQNALLTRYKDTTADWHLKVFHEVLKRALIWDYIIKDPMLGLDPIRKEKRKPEILTPNQVATLIYDSRFDLRDRCLIGLGGFAGLRISEAVAVQRGKIDFKGNSIYINLQFCQSILKPPKSGSVRHVPILPDLEPVLKEWYLKCGDTIWLFPGRKKEQPIYPSSWVHAYFRAIMQALEFPQIRFHALRHGFNKMLLDMGIPTREVMQILGHKSVGIHQHYDRESVQRLVQVTRAIKIRRL